MSGYVCKRLAAYFFPAAESLVPLARHASDVHDCSYQEWQNLASFADICGCHLSERSD